MVEVIGTDLEQLIARPLPQPAGEAPVQRGARLLGQAAVCDLADEDVLEAVRDLTRDRGAFLPGEEVA